MAEYIGVRQFFAGKSLFITGCTGFVGKMLLEKILRSCPDVESVFVLARPKKGQTVEQRFKQIFNSALFDKLRRDDPSVISKVHFIEGDLMQGDLGIDETSLALLRDKVDVVIHSAASVRFDEPLRGAVSMNLGGTKRMLDLCVTMKNLQVFLHVSTCYANCDQEVVEERVYPQKYRPEQIMDMVQWMDDDALEAIQEKLLGEKPNTYTFTKGLTEMMVKDFKRSVPFAVTIVRPSIVVASMREPVPGWVDNFNGPTGLVCAIACGFLKSVYSKKQLKTDFIPVDVVVNTILVAVWHSGVFKPEAVYVYNCAIGDRASPLTWQKLEDLQNTLVTKLTFNSAVRYPSYSFRSSWPLHRASMLLQHYLPAVVMDRVLQLVGKQPQFMVVYDKLNVMQNALTFFTTHQWSFKTEQLERLSVCLTPADRKEFSIDVSELDWDDYMYDYIKGIRDYLLKENHKEKSLWFRQLYVFEQLQNALMLFVLYKFPGVGDCVDSLLEGAWNTMF